jgi:hypothetical protein
MFYRYFPLTAYNKNTTMKKLPQVFLTSLLILTGCKEISFKEPQPQGKKFLKAVPAELHGKYFITDEDGTAKDTLTINSEGYIVGHNPNEKALLSDSLVLKYYKGFYFINMDRHPEWMLRVVKRQNNGDLLFMSMEDKEGNFNRLLRKLATEIRIDSTEVNGEKLFQIDPSPKELISLIKKGYFKQTELKKIK